MAVARKFIDKKLLHNVIRNTDAHNKIEEEKIMWRVHRAKSKRGYSTRHNDARKSSPRKNACSERTNGTYWMKELTSYESSLSDRWGHNGYKELYPEEFEDKEKDSHSDEEKRRRRKRKKEKKDRKNKARDSKKKSRTPDKIHRKRTSRKDSESFNHKASKRTKKSQVSAPSKKLSAHKIKKEGVKRRKTKHE
ncbi:uncharacterized protein NKAPD1-like [Actinia tenebrosa]|uniref:Uncharacterized protein NKAPD1-like n=1 Tax=Actinia tenebrosa TaxID=6105 RepID=A0A6P8HD76_ACTTE|nr:uncharacterized protein NKAPD1-like [Actinia tenebrosa]